MRNRRRLVAVVAGLATTAAACGGSEVADAEPTVPATSFEESTTATSTSTSTSTTSFPVPIPEIGDPVQVNKGGLLSLTLGAIAGGEGVGRPAPVVAGRDRAGGEPITFGQDATPTPTVVALFDLRDVEGLTGSLKGFDELLSQRVPQGEQVRVVALMVSPPDVPIEDLVAEAERLDLELPVLLDPGGTSAFHFGFQGSGVQWIFLDDAGIVVRRIEMTHVDFDPGEPAGWIDAFGLGHTDFSLTAPDPSIFDLPEGEELAVGSHQTSLLGTELTINVEQPWFVVAGLPGVVILEDPDQDSPSTSTEAVLLLRATSFAGSADLLEDGGAPILSGGRELAAWLDIAPDLDVVGREPSEVDGQPAVVYDIALSPDGEATIPGGCGPTEDDRCYTLLATGNPNIPTMIVRTGERYRIWQIAQAGEAPIVVFAVAAEGNERWLDERAGALVANLALGAVAPHPTLDE